MERQVLTVLELNSRIQGLLELDPMLRSIGVQGEISNYKVYSSGHHYFTLKDSESSLSCVMYRFQAVKLRFRPENGMKIRAFGKVDVYPRDGAYKLYCSSIEPEGTGDLQIAFEQMKAKLEAEGLFRAEHKKPLPAFPKTIGIITSGSGAAVHDMIRILGHRWPMTKIVLLPVRVQGVEAPPEIVGAIRYANEFKVADLLIVGRGGGSMEDLWAFNDERVARAIYASQIPIISAVGHEPDVLISDYVADRRASTPSNAAEIAVPDWRDIRDELDHLDIRSRQAVQKKMDYLREHLDNLASKRVLNDPTVYIDNRRLELDYRAEKLLTAAERQITVKRRSFEMLGASLDAMSPLRVLSRGYSIAEDEAGRPLRSVGELRPGGRVSLLMSDGQADCVVEDIRQGDEIWHPKN